MAHEKLAEIVPQPTPLDGTLYVQKSFMQCVDAAFLEQFGNAIQFTSGPKPRVFNAHGRSYHMALPEPIGMYDTLQVSGGGFSEMGIRSTDLDSSILIRRTDKGGSKIVPPTTRELFSGTTTFFEQGRLIGKRSTDPLGGYAAREAEIKLSNMRTAAQAIRDADIEDVVYLPLHAATMSYNEKDQYGENITALVFIVPNRGCRLDADLARPLAYASLVPKEQWKPNIGDLLIAGMELDFASRFRAIGKGLSALHGAGITHNQPTAGNTDAYKLTNGTDIAYFADWDTLQRPAPADKKMAQANDLVVAMISAAEVAVRMHSVELLDATQVVKAVRTVMHSYLQGYMGRDKVPSKFTDRDAWLMATRKYKRIQAMRLLKEVVATK